MLTSYKPTCAICNFESAKRAALLFDHVCVIYSYEYLGESPGPPDTIQKMADFSANCPDFVLNYLIHGSYKLSDGMTKGAFFTERHKVGRGTAPSLYATLKERTGATELVFIPVANNRNHLFPETGHGVVDLFEAIATNLPILDTRKTTWEQIESFRDDESCLKMYRDFRLWLGSISSKSNAEAIDIIGQKYDNYKFAIKKHGFDTVQGALSVFWDLKKIASVSTLIGGAGLIGGGFYAALTAGILVSSKVTLQIAEHMLGKEVIKRGEGAEVAILYEIEKKFG